MVISRTLLRQTATMRVFGVPLLGGVLEDMLVSRYTATVAKVCMSPQASPPGHMAPLPTWPGDEVIPPLSVWCPDITECSSYCRGDLVWRSLLSKSEQNTNSQHSLPLFQLCMLICKAYHCAKINIHSLGLAARVIKCTPWSRVNFCSTTLQPCRNINLVDSRDLTHFRIKKSICRGQKRYEEVAGRKEENFI